MDNLPPIPHIEGELMLEVYTHESLSIEPGAITADEHGGRLRLAILGESVLESSVMTYLFRKRPMHNATELKEMTANCVSKTSVDQWATAYNLRNKIRCTPEAVERLNDAEEGRLLFVSYVGALCVQSGHGVVQDWIDELLESSEKQVKNEPTPVTPSSPLPQQAGASPDPVTNGM